MFWKSEHLFLKVTDDDDYDEMEFRFCSLHMLIKTTVDDDDAVEYEYETKQEYSTMNFFLICYAKLKR